MVDTATDNNLDRAISAHPAIDLTLWREFQQGLSALLDIPIALYDSSGALVVPSGKEVSVCSAVGSTARGRDLCHEARQKAVEQVTASNRIYIYKCHVNQYIFAVPVLLGPDASYVIIGGQAYLEGEESREFERGVAPFGFDQAYKGAVKAGIKTIPPSSVFTIPGIINNLAVPFLKTLYEKGVEQRKGAAAALGGEPAAALGAARGLLALQDVYRSIAPLLDRDDLYLAILEKSTELVAAERGSLMILDNDNKTLLVKAVKGLDRSIAGNVKVKVGEGISGATAAKGEPLMVRDIEKEVPEHGRLPGYRTKSFISIPLKLDNRVIGVINISDKITGEVFSEEDFGLLQSVASYASIALERGAYYSMSEELRLVSMTDQLTGLFNRRYLSERIFEEVERVKRHNEHFTVFIIDIDNFKALNDRYGHLTGDEILRKVSHAIRDSVRSMDVVARYGGEEFAVILPHTGKKESVVIAERIRRCVSEQKSVQPGFDLWPTVSIGVAEYPYDAHGIDDLLNKADTAMYIAKRMGKNRVIMYE